MGVLLKEAVMTIKRARMRARGRGRQRLRAVLGDILTPNPTSAQPAWIDGDLNIQTHGWYQNRFHVKLPPWAETKTRFHRDAPFAPGTPGNNIGGSVYTMSAPVGGSTATENPPGTLNLVCDGTNPAYGDKQMTVLAGAAYKLTLTVTTPTVIASIGTTQGGVDVLANQTVPASATTSYNFTAPAGGVIWLRIRRQSAGSPVVSGIIVTAI